MKSQLIHSPSQFPILFFLFYVISLKISQQMTDNSRINPHRHQNRFNYSTDMDKTSQVHLNMHHQYFKLYEQFTSSAKDQQYKQRPKDKKSYYSYVESRNESPRLLQNQNKLLKQEVREQQQTIKQLKSELNQTITKLQRITKLNKQEAYQYQNALKDSHKEIQIILQRNRNCDEENKTLKQMIKQMNQSQIKSQYQLTQMRLYQRSKSLGRNFSQFSCNDKENQLDSNRMKDRKNEKQIESQRKFINGLKQMHQKITNLHKVSLKQLWRWLKDMGQMFHRLRKWRKNCRQMLKQQRHKSYQQIIDFINEAMIIIN